MSEMKMLCCVMGALSLLPLCGGETVESVLKRYAESTDVPGAVSVVATAQGEPRFVSVGYADIATKRKITPDSLFWIASNTKAMAAAVLLTLVDEGKVSLDDSVEKYLPEFAQLKVQDRQAPGGTRPAASKPTIRQILSHTSGLAFFPQMPIDQWPMRLLATKAAQTPQPADSGTVYRYSNWGIDVAMAVVEVVTGNAWDLELKRRILDPLGMKDTTFFPTDEQLSRLAVTYRLGSTAPKSMNVDQFQYPYSLHTRYPEAGGGLFSTPRDFIRFFQMIAAKGVTREGRRILSEKMVAEWTKKQTPACISTSYSFGLNVQPDRGCVNHGGAYQTFGEANLKTGIARIYFVQIVGENASSKARSAAWHAVTAGLTPEAARTEGQQAVETNF